MRHQGTTETLSLVSFFSTVTSEFICNRYINTRVCACSLRFLGFMYQACPRVSFRLEMVSAVVIVFRFSCFDFPLLSSIALWRWCLGVALYDARFVFDFSARFVIETKYENGCHDSCHQLQPGLGYWPIFPIYRNNETLRSICAPFLNDTAAHCRLRAE